MRRKVGPLHQYSSNRINFTTYLKREVNLHQKAAQCLCGLELCIVMSPKVHQSNSHTMYPLLPTQKFLTDLCQIKVQKNCWINVLPI